MKQKTAMFSLIIGFGLLLSWEIFEGVLWLTYSRGLGIANSFQRVIPSVFFEYETIANIAGDMVIGTLGLIVGYWAESYFRKQS